MLVWKAGEVPEPAPVALGTAQCLNSRFPNREVLPALPVAGTRQLPSGRRVCASKLKQAQWPQDSSGIYLG